VAPPLKEPAEYFDVLLRHRLLQQPGCFQGFAVRRKGDDSLYEPRVELQHRANRRIESCSAEGGRSCPTTQEDAPSTWRESHIFHEEFGVRSAALPPRSPATSPKEYRRCPERWVRNAVYCRPP